MQSSKMCIGCRPSNREHVKEAHSLQLSILSIHKVKESFTAPQTQSVPLTIVNHMQYRRDCMPEGTRCAVAIQPDSSEQHPK